VAHPQDVEENVNMAAAGGVVEDQAFAAVEHAERHGYAIVAENVDVVTAKEPGRREFSKMVEAARHDATIGAIICEKVGSRNTVL